MGDGDKNKFKDLLDKMNNKEFINNLIAILIIGIIILIICSIFKGSKKDNLEKNIEQEENKNNNSIVYDEDYTEILERKLEKILSEMSGVGNVSVMITLEEGKEKIPASNTTTSKEETSEKDSQGGVREIIRNDNTVQVITKGEDGSMVVIKEIEPKVKGVIVVAEGANDIEVKQDLYEAVKTVLGISGNKVEIYSQN